MLHALIVLGVTFTAPASDGEGTRQGMEVVLVADELPEARRNDTPLSIATHQTGSGNTRERLPAQMPVLLPIAPPESAAARENAADDEVLPPARTAADTPAQLALALSQPPRPRRLRHPGPGLRLRASDQPASARRDPDELYVTADTRASPWPVPEQLALRVERIGTINYPSVAQRRGLSGNPVIEVALSVTATPERAVQRSSGHPEIDAAALDILRLASPFDPFPP